MTRNMLAVALIGGTAAAAAAGVIVAAATSGRPAVPGEGTPVDAPFTTLEKNGNSTRIHAPFVDIEVPKRREPGDR
jgi:hypothetical protein